MNNFCYVNGEIRPANEGVIGITDLALQRGYGVFDYGRTYNGKLFHFDNNIERLRRSASALQPSTLKIYRLAFVSVTEQLLQLLTARNPNAHHQRGVTLCVGDELR